MRLLDEAGEVRLVRRVDPIGDGLEVAPQHGQRRPQLMAHVGEEGSPLALVCLQAGGHGVEGASQLPQLGAALDAPGGFDERAQGTGEAPEAAGQGVDGGDEDQDGEKGRRPVRGEARIQHRAEDVPDHRRHPDERDDHDRADDAPDRRPHAPVRAYPHGPATLIDGRPGLVIGPPRVGESVADSVDREDVARQARIRLELSAEVLDVRVDGPLVRLEGNAVNRVEEL